MRPSHSLLSRQAVSTSFTPAGAPTAGARVIIFILSTVLMFSLPMRIPSWINIRTLSAFILWTCASAGAGYAVRSTAIANASDLLGTTLRIQNDGYSLVDPLLGCTTGSTVPTPTLHELEEALEIFVATQKQDGVLSDASIYVRDMNTGAWTGVNPDASYTPASLLKVPVLITYLKQAEYNPELLTYTVTVTEDPAPNASQDIAPPESVEVGKTYSIDELLSLMIVDSDNRALNVLMNYVDTKILQQSFSDLGLTFPEEDAPYRISPRTYSRFLRILYNATYLTPESSQKALFLLSKAAFTSGIRAGVPEDIAVAHKFGEASVILDDGITGHALHDCGMVYAEHPYALCIMTTGKRVDELSSFLSAASALVYEKMSSSTP